MTEEALDNPIKEIPYSELVNNPFIKSNQVLINPTIIGRQKKFNEGEGFYGGSDGRFSIKTANGDYIVADETGISFKGTTV